MVLAQQPRLELDNLAARLERGSDVVALFGGIGAECQRACEVILERAPQRLERRQVRAEQRDRFALALFHSGRDAIGLLKPAGVSQLAKFRAQRDQLLADLRKSSRRGCRFRLRRGRFGLLEQALCRPRHRPAPPSPGTRPGKLTRTAVAASLISRMPPLQAWADPGATSADIPESC